METGYNKLVSERENIMAENKEPVFPDEDTPWAHLLDHHSDHVRNCAYCGAPMTSSDVNDYGSLCERCYMREYYGEH